MTRKVTRPGGGMSLPLAPGGGGQTSRGTCRHSASAAAGRWQRGAAFAGTGRVLGAVRVRVGTCLSLFFFLLRMPPTACRPARHHRAESGPGSQLEQPGEWTTHWQLALSKLRREAEPAAAGQAGTALSRGKPGRLRFKLARRLGSTGPALQECCPSHPSQCWLLTSLPPPASARDEVAQPSWAGLVGSCCNIISPGRM